MHIFCLFLCLVLQMSLCVLLLTIIVFDSSTATLIGSSVVPSLTVIVFDFLSVTSIDSSRAPFCDCNCV